MKTLFHHSLIAFGLLPFALRIAAGDREPINAPQIIERGQNHRVWRSLVQEKGVDGQTRMRASEVIELASGMHRFTEQGWIETSDSVELSVNGGAIANHSAHSAAFSANANSEAALQVALLDKTLKFHFAGIFLQDGAGNAAYFPVHDSIGELHAPGTIIYRNVVDGLPVDLIVVNSRSGFSQSIAFRRQLGFTMADIGLNEATTRILAYTAVDEGPEPEVFTGTFREGADRMPDDLLDWGVCKIGRGIAFSIGGEVPGEINVSKTWLRSEDGRRFIVESVPLPLDQLAALPAAEQAALGKKPKMLRAAARPQKALDQRFLAKLALNVPSAPKQTASLKRIQMAQAELPGQGFLVDFEGITSPATNVTFFPGLTYYISGDYAIYGTNYLYPCVIKFAPTNAARITSHGKLICKTEFGSPCILTARDDMSVGEVLPGTSGSQPAGFYADAAIYFTDYNMSDLSHLRISYANTALVYDDNMGAASTSSHLQITHCKTAFFVRCSSPTLRNVLVYDVQTNVFSSSYPSTTRFEHLTLDTANTFLGAPYYTPDILLTNTILAGVTNFGPGYKTNSSSNVEIVSDPGTIFTNIGAGSHYLIPQYEPIASPYINSKLLSDFRYCSVRAPLILTNLITTNTTLRPIANRMADVLTCGYAYPAIDFIVGTGISNCTVTLAPGCTIAGHTEANFVSLVLEDGGNLVSEGSPTNHIKIWRYNVAQEQANTNWITSSPGMLFAPGWWGPNPGPTARFRFTDFSSIVQGGYLLYSLGNSSSLPFVHCEFHGGAVYSEGSDLYMTNSLFESVSTFITDEVRPLSAIYQNCLFYGGSNSLEHLDAGTWKFRDNLFLNSPIGYDADPVDADYNAYPTNATTLPTSSGTHELILTNTSIAFQSGALGRFYVPSGSQTADRGSTTGGSVGLFWFTTVTNASLCESNTTVDIGFHLAGLASDGIGPRDDDSDGLLNLDEDSNSSGAVSAGETNLANSDTDGDGITDWVETILGRNPLIAGTTNDFSGALSLRVFTPLR